MAFMNLTMIGFSTTTILTLVVILCLILLYIVKSNGQKNVEGEVFEAKYPAGPPGLPVVGNLLTAGKEGWLEKQVEVYGDIFTFKVGTIPIVYVHGKALKDALNCGNLLSNRAPIPAMYDYFKDRGLVGASFHTFWKKQRSFAVRVMQSFNLGRTAGQDSIISEVDKLMQFLRKKGGKEFDPCLTLQLATANVISAFAYGHQFAYDDEYHVSLINNLRECLQSLSYRCVIMFFPRLCKLPYIGVKIVFDYFDTLRAQQRVEIEQHKTNLDKNNPKDFIDHYLIEMEKTGSTHDGFTEDNLELCLVDFFMAGTESSASTIHWCMLMLILHPDIQIKIQQELDDVIPKEQTFVTMSDQTRCVYTQAVINETQRFGCVAPFTMRAATEDALYEKYHIPKGTYFMIDYLGTMLSPKLWNNPKEFKPERFLSKEKPVTLVKQEYLLPFSSGRRNCLGERLARAELFLFIANICRNFNIRLPHGSPRPSCTPSIGFTRIPKPFKACFIPRQHETHVDTVCSDHN
ncbi:cytochrome P450 2D20-like [Amphiura filiformis]|uniref:cytochrome P450 2D20-like n=1 Tax=Amphiura filiformis TaxID=82378 RepID=UPI003B218297